MKSVNQKYSRILAQKTIKQVKQYLLINPIYRINRGLCNKTAGKKLLEAQRHIRFLRRH